MTTQPTYNHYTEIFTTSPTNTQTIVSPGFETTTLLSSITPFSLEQIGNDKFMEAYCINLERLSIQAHLTAMRKGGQTQDEMVTRDLNLFGSGMGDDEYVVDSFLEDVSSIGNMVQTLLALEFWREHVLFHKETSKNGDGYSDETDEYQELNEVDGGEPIVSLANRLAANGNGLRTAFILHAETTIVSLLNLIFYKGIPSALLEGAGGDEILLALVDYCARQLVFLGTPQESNKALWKQKNPQPTSQLASHLANRSRLNEIQDTVYDSTYRTAVVSVALSRYLCENMNDFGPSLISRICEVHDFPLLMIPLIEEPPWTRRRMSEKGGESSMIWEKLNEHNEWREMPPADLLRLTKLEGQPWLALYHLTSSKVGREAYGLDEFRKTNLMRLRKYLNKSLFDQLPVLEEVARYLDELSIMGVPPSGQGVHRPSSNASSSGLLLHRVDLLRESIVGKKQLRDVSYWNDIIGTQWESIFSRVTDAQDHLLRRIGSEIYGGNELDDNNSMLTPASPRCAEQDVNDCKSELTNPISKVVLGIVDDHEASNFDLVLIDGDSGTITNTPLGPFRRRKLSPKLVSGETQAIHPHGKVTAHIQCVSSSQQSNQSKDVCLVLSSLDLPTSQPNLTPNSYEELGISLPNNFTSKEWRQMGDLHDKNIILQLGFKRLRCGVIPAGCTHVRGYALFSAFISQPVGS